MIAGRETSNVKRERSNLPAGRREMVESIMAMAN